MSKIVAITTPDVALGFELAGIEVVRAGTAHEASDALRAVAESGEYGIVILGESFLSGFDEATAVFCAESIKPLVVTIAGAMTWPGDEERGPDHYAMTLIRRAIGHQVRIQL